MALCAVPARAVGSDCRDLVIGRCGVLVFLSATGSRGNGNAVPAVAAADSTVRTGGAGNGGSAAPDIPPLFTLLPENALPLLTGWQQEPPEQPERWVLTFEAHYPELAALLDTLSGELTQLPITRLSLHPLTPGTSSSPPLLQLTLHLALPGADSPDPEKEWHDDE
ncbi:hypothetical protein AAFX43_18350 [Morganella morganii]